MHIPKRIFQTWKSQELPHQFKAFLDTWKEIHPEFEFELWTDERNAQFIRDHYPDFLPKYLAYQYDIQRVDAIRYFLLFHYGGIYIDLDIECIKNITPLIEESRCFFGTENQFHNKIYKKERIVSNAFMGCVKGQRFFSEILDDLYNKDILMGEDNQQVLYSTGPFMIERVLKSYMYNDVVLIEPVFVSPLSYVEAKSYLLEGKQPFVQKMSDAYCVHLHWGSWWEKD